jgi:very-short-patch-repair endonuclease
MNNNEIDIRTLPYNAKLKERARNLRKAGMLHEVLLWKRLKNNQINGIDFHRQQIIGSYIVDFFSTKGFVIEADGSSHNNRVEYDAERDKFLQGCGLKVIHISVNDIFNNIDGVVKYITEETKI